MGCSEQPNAVASKRKPRYLAGMSKTGLNSPPQVPYDRQIGFAVLCLIMHGCGPLPPSRPICRDAGFGDAEVQALLPDIQAAHDAGAAREDVLADAATACAACADADPPCVATACEQCFALLINEVYGDPAGGGKASQSGG